MSDRLERWNALGPQIKRRYEDLGMNQASFLKRANLSDTAWRPVEKGEAVSLPRVTTLRGISLALGMDPGAVRRSLDEGHPLPDLGSPTPPTADALEPEVIGLAAKAGQLTAEGRARAEAYIEGLLAAEQDG